MQRGEVWWAALGKPVGSAPGFRRPVLVVQSDDFNKSALHTVVVVPLTTNLRHAQAPGNVVCGPRATGLPKASVVNVTQIIATDKTRLLERTGRLSEPLLSQVEDGILLVLGLRRRLSS